MKYSFVLLIICASCTFKKSPSVSAPTTPSAPPLMAGSPTAGGLRGKIEPSAAEKDQDKELEKISHWFEQMDAVLREGLWVVRKERAPQGKSIFGKMQRALTVERKLKLSNKSLFRCDVYSMSRKVGGLRGVPQTAEAFHKCSARESFTKFGDWAHPNDNELQVNFEGTHLSEVLGMATGIFNPKIRCKLKSNPVGIIETFSCENLMFDFNPSKNQVLKFSRFEFVKTGKQVLHLRAEVLENLEPVRKIEADVPVEGAIEVTETLLKDPYVPTPTPKATPVVGATPPPTMVDSPENRNSRNDQGNTIRAVPAEPAVPSRAVRGGGGAPGSAGGRSSVVPPGPLLPSQPSLDPSVIGGAGAGGGASGAPVYNPNLPPEQQPGEYHEGGLLPNEQLQQQQPGLQNPNQQAPNQPAPMDLQQQQEHLQRLQQQQIQGTGQPLAPGVTPMPEMNEQR